MQYHSILDAMITGFIAFFSAAAGFWGYLRNRLKVTDEQRREMVHLLMGLAHEKIMALGLCYIERNWISREEYEDLRKYLYEPYIALGGNGTAERIMHAVERLPFKPLPALDVPIRSTDRFGEVMSDENNYKGEERRGRGFSIVPGIGQHYEEPSAEQ